MLNYSKLSDDCYVIRDDNVVFNHYIYAPHCGVNTVQTRLYIVIL